MLNMINLLYLTLKNVEMAYLTWIKITVQRTSIAGVVRKQAAIGASAIITRDTR